MNEEEENETTLLCEIEEMGKRALELEEDVRVIIITY
jgi:hypothetical protein